MANARSRFWVNITSAFFVIAIVILANLALGGMRWQFDLTEDGRYTLPEAAKRIAAGLDDTLTVTAYISEPLPSYLEFVPRALQTRLEEFAAASNGNFQFSFRSPENEPGLAAELEKHTPPIKPYPLADFVQGRQTTGSYYLWLVFRYGDQESAYHLLEMREALAREGEFLRLLPFQIASKLVKVRNPEAQIGIVSEKKTPPPELQQQLGRDPSDGLAQLRDIIGKHLPPPRDVDLRHGGQIPDDIDMLLLYKPDALGEAETFEIDQFLLKGKRVVVLLDNWSSFDVDRVREWQSGLQSGTMKMRPLQHGMSEWLSHYGVVASPGLIEDPEFSASSVSVNMEVRQDPATQRMVLAPVERRRRISGLLLPQERDKDRNVTGQFSETSPALAGLGRFGMAWAVPLQVNEAALLAHGKSANGAANARAEGLVSTSRGAFVRTITDDNVPVWSEQQSVAPDKTTVGSHPLVVQVSGRFRSAYVGRKWGEDERPPRKGPDGSALPAMPNTAARLDESLEPGQLWVFADSDFCSDYAALTARNLSSQDSMVALQLAMAGFVNVMDGMLIGDDLIEIRRPNIKDRSVDSKSVDDERGSILWQAVGLTPVLLLVLALLWWMLRTAGTRRRTGAEV
ncbi:MAG: hypothetical protein EXS14_03200 [Planctomycetes bacterium]|nr:hypothetical protein [Planctomycetota bacterium]